MLLEQLIKSENTNHLFEQWQEYRCKLTDYILDCIESYNIRNYLRTVKKIRMEAGYKDRDILLSNDKKILAIWGAGSSGDIDLKNLAQYFKLVLIDRDMESLEFAKARYELRDEDCILVDLKFWDINIEDYKMLEALLIDRADTNDIVRFFQHITNNMVIPDFENIPQFDYSVAVGLVSQLNARLMALIKLYENKGCRYSKEEYLLIFDELQRMNEEAVDRFYKALKTLTKTLFIVGYEMDVYSEEESTSLKNQVLVAGSRELSFKLDKDLEEGKLEEFSKECLSWNFLDRKTYIMELRAFLELGIEV